MIDFNTEQLLTFNEASNILPGRPHVSSIHRWRLRGVRGVRLESVLLGGKRMTSLEALEKFFEQTTAAAANVVQVKVRTNRSRDSAIAEAEAALNADGI